MFSNERVLVISLPIFGLEATSVASSYLLFRLQIYENLSIRPNLVSYQSLNYRFCTVKNALRMAQKGVLG